MKPAYGLFTALACQSPRLTQISLFQTLHCNKVSGSKIIKLTLSHSAIRKWFLLTQSCPLSSLYSAFLFSPSCTRSVFEHVAQLPGLSWDFILCLHTAIDQKSPWEIISRGLWSILPAQTRTVLQVTAADGAADEEEKTQMHLVHHIKAARNVEFHRKVTTKCLVNKQQVISDYLNWPSKIPRGQDDQTTAMNNSWKD